jgi:hypothetical protein
MMNYIAARNDVVHCAYEVIDRIAAGELWLRLRVALAERRHARTLKKFGDGTFEERQMAAVVCQADTDLELWTRVPRLLRFPAQTLKEKGVAVCDLRVLLLNREIRIIGSTVDLAPPWRNYVLTMAAASVVFSGFVMLVAMITLAPASVFDKSVALGAITLLMCALYRGFSLYSSRPIGVRPMLKAFLPMEATAPNNVSPISSRIHR